MKTFLKKNQILILISIILVSLVVFLTACNPNGKDGSGEVDSSTFNPIEVDDSMNWSENANYEVTPVEYSTQLKSKYLERVNSSVYEVFDRRSLSYWLADELLTKGEKQRYEALFEAKEDSGFTSFGSYESYYEYDTEDPEICLISFTFYSKPADLEDDLYGEIKYITIEDINAAKEFAAGLINNPVTAKEKTLNKVFLFQNVVFVGNEAGFKYINQEQKEAEYYGLGVFSKAGVSEIKLDKILDEIFYQLTRAEALEIENYFYYVTSVRYNEIIDSLMTNLTLDQIGLLGYNFAIYQTQRDIDFYSDHIKDLDPEDNNYASELAEYESIKENLIETKKDLEAISQVEVLTISRIVLSMFKMGLEKAKDADIIAFIGFGYEEESEGPYDKNRIEKIIEAINSMNIGEKTLSLLIGTIADSKQIIPLLLNSGLEVEQTDAYAEGLSKALNAIKDDFSKLISIFSKAVGAANNEYYDFIESLDEEDDFYEIKAPVKMMAIGFKALTKSELHMIFSNIDKATLAMEKALKDTDVEIYEDGKKTVAELVTLAEWFSKLTDSYINAIDEDNNEVLEKLDVIGDYMEYLYSVWEIE